jgi:chromosome partitioning protein
MRVYAMANQKGGVGKTSLTINLAAALAEAGRRVLVIDWDPQGHLTTAIGATPAPGDGANLARALLGQWSGELGDLVQHVPGGLLVVPTSDDMFLLEPQMYGRPGREYLLARLVDALVDVADDVLIDCPPSLGALNDAGLVAARRRPPGEQVQGQVVIPVQAEDSSIGALKLLLRQITTLCQALGIEVDIAGLVLNLYDARRGRIATSTRTAFAQHPLGLLGTLGDRSDLREAWRMHTTVFEHAPSGPSATAFRELARALDPTLPAPAAAVTTTEARA